MADNARKTPTVVSLNAAGRLKADNAIAVLGKSLPVQITEIISNQIVKVKFLINSPFTLPEVTMPVQTSEYQRLPLQVGAVGVACPIDVFQGGVSGLGSGTADLSQRGNLATHRFIPIGNKKWSQKDNDIHTIYGGPKGVVVQDADEAKTTLTINKTSVTIAVTDGMITITASGNISINSTGGTVTVKGSQVELNP